MSWRYQPVIEIDDQGTQISLCECYFDRDGNLESWTERAGITPCGETREDLQVELTRMLVDCMSWRAVKFSEMKVGMKFEMAVTMEQRIEIADLIDSQVDDFSAAARAVN